MQWGRLGHWGSCKEEKGGTLEGRVFLWAWTFLGHFWAGKSEVCGGESAQKREDGLSNLRGEGCRAGLEPAHFLPNSFQGIPYLAQPLVTG